MTLRLSATSNGSLTSTASADTGIAKWGIRALELCLLAGIIYFVVRAFIGFLSPQSLWTDTSPQDQNISTTQAGDNPDINASDLTKRLSTYDPFNRRSDPDAVIDIIADDVPETTLDLRLFGLRAGEEGSAILQTPDQRQDVYKVGQEIIDGVVLKSVSSNYIVISQSGNLERLTFEREAALNQRGAEAAALGGSTNANDALEAALTARLQNATPEEFLKAVSLKPVLERGQRKGFRVGSSGVDISQFGIQPGDVITHIGSQDIRQGRPQIAKLISTLGGAKSVNVSIIRNGQPQTIEVGRR